MPDLHEQQQVYQFSNLHSREAFDGLYQRYIVAIQKYVHYRIPGSENVDDLTAEVFGKAWEYAVKNPKVEIRNFRALLYKIARNEIANFYQAQGRIPMLVELDDPEEDTEVPDARTDSLQKLLNKQDQTRLIKTVQKLPEPYKEIVALRFFEELEIAEIAEIIGKTMGNTRVLIHRSVKALQKIYDREGTDPTIEIS